MSSSQQTIFTAGSLLSSSCENSKVNDSPRPAGSPQQGAVPPSTAVVVRALTGCAPSTNISTYGSLRLSMKLPPAARFCAANTITRSFFMSLGLIGSGFQSTRHVTVHVDASPRRPCKLTSICLSHTSSVFCRVPSSRWVGRNKPLPTSTSLPCGL